MFPLLSLICEMIRIYELGQFKAKGFFQKRNIKGLNYEYSIYWYFKDNTNKDEKDKEIKNKSKQKLGKFYITFYLA